MSALGKSFLGMQTPTTDARQANNKTENYTDCICPHVQPLSGSITHYALASLDDETEKQQPDTDFPIRMPSEHSREPQRKHQKSNPMKPFVDAVEPGQSLEPVIPKPNCWHERRHKHQQQQGQAGHLPASGVA